MNKKLITSIILNIILLVFFFHQILPFFNNVIIPIISLPAKSISTFAAAMSAIAAFLSFCIALANFYELKTNNRKEPDKYLFRKMVIDNFNNVLNDFYDNAINSFDTIFDYLSRDPAAILAINRFSKEYTKRQEILTTHLIDYINEIDTNLGNSVKDVLKTNRNEVAKLLHESFNMDDPADSPGNYDKVAIKNDFDLLLAKQRRDIIHLILSHQI